MRFLTKLTAFLLLVCLMTGCQASAEAQVAATTLPVYQFTQAICQDTPIEVARLVTESVSCLHDYTLTINQMRSIESAQLVVISGAGLEEFMEEALEGAESILDASRGIDLLEGDCHHDHGEDDHEMDSHIWLSPANAMIMAQNICVGLCEHYPEHADTFQSNLQNLLEDLTALNNYALDQLSVLSSREIITFHDGFGYLADAYGLVILEAIEEESGAEISAQELLALIRLIQEHDVKAIFTETNGSDSAASILQAETGVDCNVLDMAISGDDYFESMYRNIDILKEALQ